LRTTTAFTDRKWQSLGSGDGSESQLGAELRELKRWAENDKEVDSFDWVWFSDSGVFAHTSGAIKLLFYLGKLTKSPRRSGCTLGSGHSRDAGPVQLLSCYWS
jgi:hypothetical protein